jgi:hypothetical protein
MHNHSAAPLGATNPTVSQSERNPYSAIGGNALGKVAPGSGPIQSQGSTAGARIRQAGILR